MAPLYGGVEAGGHKFVCAVGSGPDDLRDEAVIPTTSPGETIARVVDFFRKTPDFARVAAFGIGSFGPVDIHAGSPTFGHITSTPKPGWADTDLVGPLGREFGLPVAFDTDVNAAALGEHTWGAAAGHESFIYLTVGTGIGGGAIVGGSLLHGLVHPEMGHILVPHDIEADPFPGVCPYHGDCLEGLASGPAIEKRWGDPGERLPDGHPAWPLEARYLGLGVAGLVCALSPELVVIGGGVMKRPPLLSMVRRAVLDSLGGYVRSPRILDEIDAFIVRPALGDRAGVLGAIKLAQEAT